MTPSEAFETREVAVGGDELASVLDGQRSNIGVCDQRALDASTLTEVDEDFPMSVRWKNGNRLRPLNQLPAELECRRHRSCGSEDLWIGHDSEKTTEHELREREGLGSVD